MNELSCRVIIGLVEMAGRAGIPADSLLEGHRHPPDHLMNPRMFTDWTTGMQVVRRMRVAAGSREAFLKIGQAYGQTRSFRYLHRLTGAVFSPEDLFGFFDLAAVHHEDLLSSNQALFQTEHARSELARDLLLVADGERAKFAREVHDELAQELFAIRLFAESLASLNPQDLPARAGHLAELASRAEHTARSLARSYDPIAGAGDSFTEAVRALTHRHSGKVLFNLAGIRDVPLERSRASHLHRIVQEAVTNAVRHGRATLIHIILTPGEPWWELHVEDNGRGFPPGQVPDGLGLRTMAYRANQLGGTLRVINGEAGGVRLTCAFRPGSGGEATPGRESGVPPPA